MADYDSAYNKKALLAEGAGPGNSPYWMPGGVFGGVPMGGGRRNMKTKLSKSKKMYKKGGSRRKHLKRTMRKMKRQSRK